MYINLRVIILFVALFLIALYYLYLSRKELKETNNHHEKEVEELWKKINNLDTQVYRKEQKENELKEKLREEEREFKHRLNHTIMDQNIKEIRLTFNCSEEEAEDIWTFLEAHLDAETYEKFYKEISITKRKNIYKKAEKLYQQKTEQRKKSACIDNQIEDSQPEGEP